MLITPFAQTLPSMPLYNKAFCTMLIFTDPLGFRTNWGPTHLVVSDDRKNIWQDFASRRGCHRAKCSKKKSFRDDRAYCETPLLHPPVLPRPSAWKPPQIASWDLFEKEEVEKVQCYCNCFSPQAPWWIILNFSWKGLSDGCSIVDPALVKIPMMALCRLKACGCVQEYVPYRPSFPGIGRCHFQFS